MSAFKSHNSPPCDACGIAVKYVAFRVLTPLSQQGVKVLSWLWLNDNTESVVPDLVMLLNASVL